MFHIHHPFMTFSSNLLSPQIKTRSRLQAQIGICKSSCALSAVRLPPGTLRDLRLSFAWVWTALRGPVAGPAYASRRLSLGFLILLLRMPPSCAPERTAQKSKSEWGRLAQPFALSPGGFVSLSGRICCKTQVNHGVTVDIKSKRQRRMKGKYHKTCRSTLR